MTGYWLLLGLVARSRDIPIGDGLLLDCLQSGWRGAGVAAGAALAGYALTMLFRSTVAALGVLLAASVAGGIVLAVIGVDSVWNPGLNVAAVILDGATVLRPRDPARAAMSSRGTCSSRRRCRSVARCGSSAPAWCCSPPPRSRPSTGATCPDRSGGLEAGFSTPRSNLSDVSAPVPEGRKLLRLEVRNAETPIERKPSWIKTRAKMGPEYTALQSLVKSEGLHTVCQEAGCPNIFECWEDREATFLIGGDQCTRRCDFCQIDTGKPQPLDRDEPRRVAESVKKMELRYATITGVARDDLDDGGAWLYAETVRAIHELNPGTGVENLIPDFNGIPDLLEQVFESRPEVLAHNVETVPRIFKRIRPAFRYDRSLDVLTQARAFGLVTKSNLILGMGETREEVSQAMRDLHDAGCELLTITQYLRPSVRHHPVERWVKPEEFVELQQEATELGFAGVLSGPLVRSSYRAGRLYRQAMDARAARQQPHRPELHPPTRSDRVR